MPSSNTCLRCGASVPADRAPGSRAIWLLISALALMAIGLGVLIPALVHQSQKRADQRYWLENYDRILSLKADAERLAVAGKLADAHASYQQLERIVGGRTPSDSRLWDLTERAKQDQDRVFAMLMAAQVARFAPEAQAQQPPSDRYRSYTQPAIAAASPRPSLPATMPAASPRSLLAAAAGAFSAPAPNPAPTTRPVVVAPPRPAGPTIDPRTLPSAADLTDAQIGQAIQRGVDFLLKHFEADQISIPGQRNDTYLEGLDALCVYSLLQAGQAINNPRLDIKGPLMKGLLSRMKDHMYTVEMGNPVTPVTYARSFRTLALAVHSRPEDREVLQADVKWLVLASSDGAYTYDDQAGRLYKDARPRFIGPTRDGKILYRLEQPSRPVLQHNGEVYVPYTGPPPPAPPPLPKGYDPRRYSQMLQAYRNRLYSEVPEAPWDNSNTQYGQLALWAAIEIGCEVPMDYWMAAEKHWMSCQLPTGQWGYSAKNTQPSYAMTTAGIASLFITHDYLDAPALAADVGRNPFNSALARGLAWLEKSGNCLDLNAGGMQYLGYNLFGLERIGLASGFKYFGAHDWFRALSAKILPLQKPDGSWCRDLENGESDDHPKVIADALIDTAYVVLFLARGRHPVMINKLRFDGYWNNRSREIANLARFAGRELERPLNWQVVPFTAEWSEWMDSPILYIASHQAPKLQPEHIQKLRAFAEAGGLIFTHADASAQSFNNFAVDLARKVFPEYELSNLPLTHELYSLQYRLATKPPLKAVSNGSRLLLVHSPNDLSTAWQVRNGTKRECWDLAINLFVYAAGKTDFRNRLNSPYIAPIPGRAASMLRLARLKYPTNWNPEPHAFERFARYFRQQTGIGLDLTSIDIRNLTPDTAPLAHLTGNVPYTPTDADLAALRTYVESGGIVLIDSCGGSERFAQSAAALLDKLAPGKKTALMDFKHPLFTAPAPGMDDLTRPAIRPYAKIPAQFHAISIGKGKVISTPLDLTTGLLGTNTWSLSGYKPDYAQKFVKNVLLWAAAGAKD